MGKNKLNPVLLVLESIILLVSFSCGSDYTPKPRGYFRITFPPKSYKPLNFSVPYNFQIPAYSYAEADSFNLDQPYWLTIQIPSNHAQIHISYIKLDRNLSEHIENSRSLVYKHVEKASSIEERIFVNPISKVYGTLYTIKGNAASPMQFYLTDSTSNFLRGALYIKEVPNSDSLRPVIRFLSEDVLQLVESTKWENIK
jgi:gliding motility-associated lipoprotein GldD